MCTSMLVVHSQSHSSGRYLWRHRTNSVCRLCVVLPYDNRRQCGNCLREYPLFFRWFRRFCPVEDDLIAVTAVLDGTVDAADRGSACTGFLDDFMKDVSAVEHFCHLLPLCHGSQFLISAEVFEKGVAFLRGTQRENGFKESFLICILSFFFHF